VFLLLGCNPLCPRLHQKPRQSGNFVSNDIADQSWRAGVTQEHFQVQVGSFQGTGVCGMKGVRFHRAMIDLARGLTNVSCNLSVSLRSWAIQCPQPRRQVVFPGTFTREMRMRAAQRNGNPQGRYFGSGNIARQHALGWDGVSREGSHRGISGYCTDRAPDHEPDALPTVLAASYLTTCAFTDEKASTSSTGHITCTRRRLSPRRKPARRLSARNHCARTWRMLAASRHRWSHPA